MDINLRIAGYECTVVDDCFDTVNFVMDENPNLLITDLMMPKTDGYEICRRIRVISTIPIIMFTSMTLDQEIRTKAATAGASMVMSKSIDIPDLLAEINSLLQG